MLELDQKFWLRFATVKDLPKCLKKENYPGLIVSAEELTSSPELTFLLKTQLWDLLILDEAHHSVKKPDFYEDILDLSQMAERSLIISATPIQHRSEELLALLKIMDPEKYGNLKVESFNRLVENQLSMLRKINGITSYNLYVGFHIHIDTADRHCQYFHFIP